MEEWVNIVKLAKKRSTSLIFYQRNYSIYKYAVESTKMNAILVKFCSIIIEQVHYPRRWLKILDIIIEKGKGLVFGKL